MYSYSRRMLSYHPNLKSIFVKNIVDSFIEQLIKSASFYDVKIRTAAMIAES